MAVSSTRFAAYASTVPPAPTAGDFSQCIVSSNEHTTLCWQICQEMMISLNTSHTDLQDLQNIFCKFINDRGEKIRSAFPSGIDSLPGQCSRPLKGSYLPMVQALEKFEETNPSLVWELYSDAQEGFCECYRMGRTHKNEVIQLVHYTFMRNNPVPEGGLPATIGYPVGANLGKALEQCEYLYNSILHPQAPLQGTSQKILELHWWLSQASPIMKNNDRFVEILTSALTLHRFGTIAPYKQGVKPCQIALVTSLNEFVAGGVSLRE